jgi:hypothetical protein
MPQFKGVFALRADAYNEIYGLAERATLCTVADEIAPLWPGSPLSYLPPNIMLTQHIAHSPDPVHCRLGRSWLPNYSIVSRRYKMLSAKNWFNQ